MVQWPRQPTSGRNQKTRTSSASGLLLETRHAPRQRTERKLHVAAIVLVDPRIGASLGVARIEACIEQVRGHDVAHGSEDRRADARMVALDVREQALHAPALQVFLCP